MNLHRRQNVSMIPAAPSPPIVRPRCQHPLNAAHSSSSPHSSCWVVQSARTRRSLPILPRRPWKRPTSIAKSKMWTPPAAAPANRQPKHGNAAVRRVTQPAIYTSRQEPAPPKLQLQAQRCRRSSGSRAAHANRATLRSSHPFTSMSTSHRPPKSNASRASVPHSPGASPPIAIRSVRLVR